MMSQRTYGRRKGRKLRPAQEELFHQVLPSVLLLIEDGKVTGPSFNPNQFKTMFLEIGFGTGEHLILQARNHPDTLVIGCEPFVNGVAQALKGVQEHNLQNVAIYPGNAIDLLPVLPESSLDKIFLLFPDPWPKKGHHKRRFVCKENLDLMAKALKVGGELLIATDHAGYFEWILERAPTYPAFTWMNPNPETWTQLPSLWTTTRFQEKAHKAGREAQFLLFRR